MFRSSGFFLAGDHFLPCGTVYHGHCIRVAEPFTTRLYNKNSTQGLQFPTSLTGFPFICELCTVRAHLGREIDSLHVTDLRLLALERIRLIDMAHGWAEGTLLQYSNRLRQHITFRSDYDLMDLPVPGLLHPPVDENIILFWHMELYLVTKNPRAKDATPKFNTARQFRSAYSAYSSWVTALCQPKNTYKDKEKRLLTLPTVGPSDTLSATMISHGLGVRLGTHTKQSMALHQRHVHRNQDLRLEALLNSGSSPLNHYRLIAAQCVELIGWLGWLRSNECFSLQRKHIEIVHPDLHDLYNLPPSVGVVILTLLDPTKTNQTSSADVVLAYQTSSGLKPGEWFTLLFHYMDKLGYTSPNCFLFRHEDGTRWSSHFFRHTYLFPYLEMQREAGDVYLQIVDGTEKNTFADKFYSFHTYRIGAGNHCNRKREGCLRKADPYEKQLQGRWRIKNRGIEAIDIHYQQPTIEDMVWLTLCCF